MGKLLELTDRKQFRILLHPVRQEIIHLLRLRGRAMTARAVADRLQLSPMAAQGHLKKLSSLGILQEEVRTVQEGHTATFYTLDDVEIRLCLGRKDAFQGDREALAANLVDGTFRGLMNTSHLYDDVELKEHGMLLFGALHLPSQQRKELRALVEAYLRTHSSLSQEDVEHWEYVLLAYRGEPGKTP